MKSLGGILIILILSVVLLLNTMAQWSVGDEITAAKLNANRGFEVGFEAWDPTGTPITSASGEVTIYFTTETFDIGSDYDPVTGMFTAPYDGYYLVYAMFQFDNTDAGIIGLLRLRKNASTLLWGHSWDLSAEGGGQVTRRGFSKIIKLEANETLRITVEQTSSTPIIAGSSLEDYFGAFLISRE